VYCVVVDAALPYHHKEQQRYICTLKLIDHTYYTRGTEPADSYKHINCVFHARRIEDCPQINMIGDLIRIHKAQVRDLGVKKQL
jgi:hypothetical protein